MREKRPPPPTPSETANAAPPPFILRQAQDERLPTRPISIVIPAAQPVIPAKAGIHTLPFCHSGYTGVLDSGLRRNDGMGRRAGRDIAVANNGAKRKKPPFAKGGWGDSPRPTHHESPPHSSPSFRRRPESRTPVGGGVWIPAFAGMTGNGAGTTMGWRLLAGLAVAGGIGGCWRDWRRRAGLAAAGGIGGGGRFSLTQPSPAGRGLSGGGRRWGVNPPNPPSAEGGLFRALRRSAAPIRN